MSTIIDPPEGWRYGFPKEYDLREGETLANFLRRNNYPESLIPLAEKHSRYWANPGEPKINNPHMPTKEGFFWGKWKIKADGTDDPFEGPGDEWEVMHVVENCIDRRDLEHLMVMVPGVTKWQPLENFYWGNCDEVIRKG